MVTVNKQDYDMAKVVGNDVIVGGNIDGTHTVNRLYALYRNDKVVAYTRRQLQIETPKPHPYPPPLR